MERSFGPHSFDLMSLDSDCRREERQRYRIAFALVWSLRNLQWLTAAFSKFSLFILVFFQVLRPSLQFVFISE